MLPDCTWNSTQNLCWNLKLSLVFSTISSTLKSLVVIFLRLHSWNIGLIEFQVSQRSEGNIVGQKRLPEAQHKLHHIGLLYTVYIRPYGHNTYKANTPCSYWSWNSHKTEIRSDFFKVLQTVSLIINSFIHLTIAKSLLCVRNYMLEMPRLNNTFNWVVQKCKQMWTNIGTYYAKN